MFGTENSVAPSEDASTASGDGASGATKVKIAFFQVNPVTKTGQRGILNIF